MHVLRVAILTARACSPVSCRREGAFHATAHGLYPVLRLPSDGVLLAVPPLPCRGPCSQDSRASLGQVCPRPWSVFCT